MYIHTYFRRKCILDNKPTKKPSENLHKGHRERLKSTYKATGLNGFHDHVALELLLFFAIPYKDTNPIAHELLNRFGSLSGVFGADIESLKSVKNMTENAAILITLVPKLAALANPRSQKEAILMTSRKRIDSVIEKTFEGESVERVYVFILDKNNMLIDRIPLGEGSNSISRVHIGEFIKNAAVRNSDRIFVAHNHPDNSGISSNDVVASNRIAYHLKTAGITLTESYLYTKNKVIGIIENEKHYS